MKKLLLSAALVVAFSLTSFAAEKVVSKEIVKERESKNLTIVKEKVEGCDEVVLTTSHGYSDGQGGMILEFHYVHLLVCDDGAISVLSIK